MKDSTSGRVPPHDGLVEERRRHSRFTVNVTVDVARGGSEAAGIMSNISEGGAFIQLAVRLPAGTRVSVSVPRAGAAPMALPALVCRVALNGVGVAWEECDEPRQRLIDELVAEADPDSGPA